MAAELGGLLKNEYELRLYEAACDLAKPEWTTGHFWMRVLQRQFPFEDGYSLAPEVAPTEDSGKRVDVGVFALFDKDLHPLLFVEWKRAAKDSPGERRAAEEQVLGYCNEYLTANPTRLFMHTMVCTGGRARIWRVNRRDPNFAQPDTSRAGPDLYTDAKEDPPDVLLQGFEEVRRSQP